MAATKSIKITEAMYIETIAPCIKTAVSRNERYGNSIDLCSNTTIMELVQMKLERNKVLAPADPKYIDEIQDSINYLVYILMRGKQK